jgi:hypothetical protein
VNVTHGAAAAFSRSASTKTTGTLKPSIPGPAPHAPCQHRSLMCRGAAARRNHASANARTKGDSNDEVVANPTRSDRSFRTVAHTQMAIPRPRLCNTAKYGRVHPRTGKTTNNAVILVLQYDPWPRHSKEDGRKIVSLRISRTEAKNHNDC